MSSGARPVPHRVHRLYRRVVWLFIGLTAAAGIVLGVVVGIDRAFSSTRQSWPQSWPPKPCVVRGIDARCGTFTVPENRAKPTGRTIGLRVVVFPAASKPVRKTRSRTWPAGRETPLRSRRSTRAGSRAR